MTPRFAMDARIRRLHAELRAFLERRAPGYGEEIAQEVWLRVARVDPTCPDDASFRAYAYTAARRQLVDHARRRAARVHLVPLEGGAEPSDRSHAADRRLRAADALAVVEATLATMKPELAEVFRWRTGDDVAFREIAARQGVGLNTALGRMHQATRKVHAALASAGLIAEDSTP